MNTPKIATDGPADTPFAQMLKGQHKNHESDTPPHLDEIHRTAVRLSGVLNAIAFLENQDACREGQATLIFIAEEIGQQLESDLDRFCTQKGG